MGNCCIKAKGNVNSNDLNSTQNSKELPSIGGQSSAGIKKPIGKLEFNG